MFNHYSKFLDCSFNRFSEDGPSTDGIALSTVFQTDSDCTTWEEQEDMDGRITYNLNITFSSELWFVTGILLVLNESFTECERIKEIYDSELEAKVADKLKMKASQAVSFEPTRAKQAGLAGAITSPVSQPSSYPIQVKPYY